MKIAKAPKQGTLKVLYIGAIGLCVASVGLFIAYLSSTHYDIVWSNYIFIYIALLLGNSWYVLGLMVYEEYHQETWQDLPDDKLISVIVPCYNESVELFSKTLYSIFQARGNKEIILIDDGSTANCRYLIELLEIRPSTKVHIFESNMGKREALTYAVNNLLSPDSYCVVTIDSDTILDKDALVKVAAPLLENPHIGAVTGNVELLNEKENILTRMIGTYYWMGLNMYKKAQSALGIVVCCSGCLSAYRTPLLREIIDEFNAQEFLGQRCTHSEDRHLTNLILRRGYKVFYVSEAISYTETPSTLKGFCRQQLRWKRGYVRESIYTLSYAWKNQRRLFFQILLWDLSSPYITLGLRLAIILVFVFNPLFVLTFILPLWLMATLLRYMYVALRAPKKLPGLIVYAFFFELILYWVNLYALFTVKDKRWVTRGV